MGEAGTRLKLHLTKKRFRTMPYAVTAAFLIGAFILGSPSATKAFTPYVQTIKQLQSDVISMIFGNDTEHNSQARTSPPPDSVNVNEGITVDAGVLEEQHFENWYEAAYDLLFPAPKIGYVPASFTLKDVILFSKSGEKAKRAVLVYANETDAKSFMLTIRMLEQNETVTTGSDASGGDYESVQVNGQPGFLFMTKDGRSSLDFMSGNTLISISGALSKNEILKIGENIR